MSQQNRATMLEQLEKGNIREKLRAMERDPLLNTRTSSFSTNTSLYPDGQIPFVDKHIAYLLDHPQVNPDYYLSNLRLMLKNRR